MSKMTDDQKANMSFAAMDRMYDKMGIKDKTGLANQLNTTM